MTPEDDVTHEEDCVCLECVRARKDSYDGSTEQAMDEIKNDYLRNRFTYEDKN